MLRRALVAIVAVLALLAGMAFNYWRTPAVPEVAAEQASGLVGRPRPPFTLGAVNGSRVSASDFDGRVTLLNFWATWCAPCREEMPMLVEVSKAYADQGLAVVGIALDDVEQARSFADSLGVTYTVLVGGADVMAVSQVYGNQASLLPYTVLIDAAGIVIWTHLGELDRNTLEKQLNAVF